MIGCGHLGRIHARLLSGIEGAQLVAVADPVAESRRLAAAETGAVELADYRDAIGLADAAIIAAPASLHHAIGMELLRHGIHLLMEKPMAVNVAQAEELVWAANWHGAVLQVGHIEQFNPALARVLPLVQNPRLIEANRASGYTFRSTDIGVVLDLMIHDLDIALSLARSPVRSVSAVGMAVMGDREDVAEARIEFANGSAAHLSASRVSYRARREMQIWSPHGQVEIDFATRRTIAVEPADTLLDFDFNERNLSAEQKQQLQKNLFAELLPAREQEAPPQNALVEEQRDFVESVATGRAPRVTGEQGARGAQSCRADSIEHRRAPLGRRPRRNRRSIAAVRLAGRAGHSSRPALGPPAARAAHPPQRSGLNISPSWRGLQPTRLVPRLRLGTHRPRGSASSSCRGAWDRETHAWAKAHATTAAGEFFALLAIAGRLVYRRLQSHPSGDRHPCRFISLRSIDGSFSSAALRRPRGF